MAPLASQVASKILRPKDIPPPQRAIAKLIVLAPAEPCAVDNEETAEWVVNALGADHKQLLVRATPACMRLRMSAGARVMHVCFPHE